MRTAILLTAVLALLALAPAADPTPEFWFQPDPQVAQLQRENAKLKRSVHYHAALVRRLQRALRHDPNVSEAIKLAATTFSVSSYEMWRVAFCETGGTMDPRSKNRHSTASGLFEFLYPSSWRSTPYRGFSVWSPYASSMAAAWTRRHDGSWRQWQCQP